MHTPHMRRRRRARRPGALSGLVLAGTLVLGGISIGSAAAGAAPDADTDPVAEVLADPGALTTLRQVRELGERTADDTGVPIGVISDTNGAAPGGIDVVRVVAHRSQVRSLTAQLAQVDGVVEAAVDQRVHATADPNVAQQYGPTSIRANVLASTADGLGTVVAVVDSGVQASHPDLSPQLRNGQPRVLTGTSFLRPASGPDLVTGTPGNTDPDGHGTHVAGIIAAARGNGLGGAGVAPGAQILPVRVLDENGSGWGSDVTAGILWAHQQGADVINLSLSGAGTEPTSMVSAINTVTTDTSRGKAPTVVVAAAGNDGPNSAVQWPAAAERVLAVAATDAQHRVAPFSSWGSYVDVAAPGDSILSTCPGGYCYASGTSMASPLAAGAVAILRQQSSGYGPNEVRSRLQDTSRDVASPGWDTATGYGEIDLAAAYDSSTWPPFPRLTPPPAPAPAPPVQLPTGSYSDAFADGRRLVVAGRVNDPDGPPTLIVNSPLFGDRSPLLSASGQWLGMFDVGPGTHQVCVTALDNPTGQAVWLGCREVVVK